MIKNRRKFVVPLVLVTVVLGAVLIVSPQYFSSFFSANANGQISNGQVSNAAPAVAPVPAKLDVASTDSVNEIRIARADTPTSADTGHQANGMDRKRSLNESGSIARNNRIYAPAKGQARVRAGSAVSRRVLGCAIEPDKTAEVGSPVVGVVSSITIERGDRVEQDQELARLRANVEQASVAVAQARTQADAEVRAAQTNADFLRQKLTRAEELVELNFISTQALEEARADARMAEERLAQAHEQQRVWQKELNLANAQLQMRTIRAPFDGIVVDRHVSVGERIEDKPLFRIVKTDPLRVEIVAPSTMFGTVQMGTIVNVMPELPNAPALPAEVVLVDSVVDGASNTFRVRAKLPNPDGALPSGLRCRAELTDVPAPMVAPRPAGPAKELAPPVGRRGLKVDTNLASMQRLTANAAHGSKKLSPQNQ
jgi:RND family efflux transporter MFP subunit